MTIINRLNIGTRLWLGLIIALAFVGFVTLQGWSSMQFSANQADALVTQETQITRNIAAFHKDFITTLQISNNYVLTLDKKEGELFNQRIDQQIKALQDLLVSLGAQVEHDQAGFLQFSAEPAEHQAALLRELLSIDNVLMNLKKSTNSNVYLKNRLSTTIDFGLERSAKSLVENLDALQPLIKGQPGLVDASRDLKQRLEISQLLAAKMIAKNDPSLKDVFDQIGLGFSALGLSKSLEEAFAGDFFNRELAESVSSSHSDYFDAFGDLRDFITTAAQNNQSLAQLSETGNMTLLALMAELQNNSLQSLQHLQTNSDQQADRLLIWGSIAVLVLLLINLSITRSIVQPLNRMRAQVLQVASSGEFSHWTVLSGRNELSEMSQAQLQLLNKVSQALNEVKTVSEALAQGDTAQRMSAEYQGALARLSLAMNNSLQSVNTTFNEIAQLSHALEQGNLSFEIELHVHSGQFLEVLTAMTNA